jgi:hypothetical protein
LKLVGFWKDPPFYFEEIVWPSYLKYNQKAFATSSILPNFLELKSDQIGVDEMVELAVDHLEKVLK